MSSQIGPRLTAFHVAPTADVVAFLNKEFQLKLISQAKKSFRQSGSDRDERKEVFFELQLDVLTFTNGDETLEVVKGANWDFLLSEDSSVKILIEKIVPRISRQIQNIKYNLPGHLNEGLDAAELQKYFADFTVQAKSSSFYRSLQAKREPFDEISFGFVSAKSLGQRGFDVPEAQKSLYSFIAQVLAPPDQAVLLADRVRSFFNGLGLPKNS